MLKQLKAELARIENLNTIDDLIIENVSMESIKESFMADYMHDYEEFDVESLMDDEHEIAELEKVINDLPEYTNESDMNLKVKGLLEFYIPEFKAWEE
jgi:hypothetical protein